MSKTKRAARFVVGLVIIPFMFFVMGIIACIEALSTEPDWDHYSEFFHSYTDMLTFK